MHEPVSDSGEGLKNRVKSEAAKAGEKKEPTFTFKQRLIVVLAIILAIGFAEFVLFVYGQFSDIAILDKPELNVFRSDLQNDTFDPSANITVDYYTVELELDILNRGRIEAKDIRISAWLTIINASGYSKEINSIENWNFNQMSVLEIETINVTFKNVPVEYDNKIDFFLTIRESGKVTEMANSTIKPVRKFYIEPESKVELTTKDLLERDSRMFFYAICFEGIIVLATIIWGIIIVHDKLLALAVSALGLAPLFRIVNVATPMAFNFLVFVTMSYGFLLVAVFVFIYVNKISWKDIGVTTKKLYIWLPLGIFLGFLLAPIEYYILGSQTAVAWIPKPNLVNILVLSLVMFLFVGLAEELMFRSLIQTHLEKITTPYTGLFLTALLFGLMHGVWTSYLELVFTFVAGLLFGYLFLKTRNLPFIAILHGAEDVFLFGILPFLL
jgi:membrane protease YdiL (CAAX protease family)